MRRILTTTKFERRLKIFFNLHPELTKRVESVMFALASNRSVFKVHKLAGKLKGCFAASITKAYRIVFISNLDEICFIDIGDHDDVYR